MDTRTSGTALHLATHSSTQLKNKESPEDERSRSGGGVPSSPGSWLDKRLTPPQLSGASLHSSFPEELVHDGTISFGVSCLSS